MSIFAIISMCVAATCVTLSAAAGITAASGNSAAAGKLQTASGIVGMTGDLAAAAGGMADSAISNKKVASQLSPDVDSDYVAAASEGAKRYADDN